MRKFLFSLLLIMLALPAAAQDKSESVYARAVRTGSLRCGYALWAPILYQDMQTGTLAGFSYDVMNEIGKRLGLKIDWAEESAWGTLVEGLSTHRYDMICVAFGNTAARGKVIAFSAPLFYSPLYLVSRSSDKRFDKGYMLLNAPKYRIAVLDGEMSALFSARTLPLAATDALPQTADYAMLLKEVETKKADATFVTPETFAAYNAGNPGLLKLADPQHPVMILPVSFGLPIDDPALKNMMDVTVTEMINDGTVDRLLTKYEKYPGTFLRVPQAYGAR